MKKISDICYRIFIKDLFATKGRANRTEYIVRFLLMLMGLGIVFFLEKYIEYNDSFFILVLFNLLLIIAVIFIIQVFFVIHRRLHDLNFSGWWQFFVIFFVTILHLDIFVIIQSVLFLFAVQSTLSLFVLLITIALAIFNGTRGPNNYGEQPGNFFWS